jgi:hypothetical protein
LQLPPLDFSVSTTFVDGFRSRRLRGCENKAKGAMRGWGPPMVGGAFLPMPWGPPRASWTSSWSPLRPIPSLPKKQACQKSWGHFMSIRFLKFKNTQNNFLFGAL